MLYYHFGNGPRALYPALSISTSSNTWSLLFDWDGRPQQPMRVNGRNPLWAAKGHWMVLFTFPGTRRPNLKAWRGWRAPPCVRAVLWSQRHWHPGCCTVRIPGPLGLSHPARDSLEGTHFFIHPMFDLQYQASGRPRGEEYHSGLP